jgi:hypothetical protein
MKKLITISSLIVLAIAVSGVQNVFSLSYSNNITLFDGKYQNASWYNVPEDQEVEPGMITGQQWDLEAFFIQGWELTMVGGYNFVTGQDGWTSGDIFIDTDGDAVYGDITGSSEGNKTVTNRFGYDYVLDMNFSNNTYNVIHLTDNTQTITAYYRQNYGGNPWQYASGGSAVAGWQNIGFQYVTGLTNATTGLTGGSHNAVGVNLGFLPSGINYATVHFTMKCGNDNLMGQFQPVPEPSTFLLLGAGLLGMMIYRRRK